LNFPVESISSLLPLRGFSGMNDSSMPVLQKAFQIKPDLVSKAVGQAMAGSSASPLTPGFSLSSLHALNPLSGAKTHSDSQLRKVSHDFESIFLQMMFKEMRHSVEKTNLFGNSQASEFFENMQDEELSKQLASAGGIGIGDQIYQKLKQVTEPHIKSYP
jgi:Rod binding domain-containing protein